MPFVIAAPGDHRVGGFGSGRYRLQASVRPARPRPPATVVLPAAGDEVSVAIASLFSGHARPISH